MRNRQIKHLILALIINCYFLSLLLFVLVKLLLSVRYFLALVLSVRTPGWGRLGLYISYLYIAYTHILYNMHFLHKILFCNYTL